MNREERWVGAVIALSLWYFIGWYSLLAIPLCARLWAMGGSARYDKNWRRICVPIVLCGFMTLNLKSNLPLISLPFIFAVLTKGYGIPDGIDAGSPIGRYWYYRCGQDDDKATIMTRITICLLLGIALLPLASFSLIFWYLSVTTMMILVPLVVICIA